VYAAAAVVVVVARLKTDGESNFKLQVFVLA